LGMSDTQSDAERAVSFAVASPFGPRLEIVASRGDFATLQEFVRDALPDLCAVDEFGSFWFYRLLFSPSESFELFLPTRHYVKECHAKLVEHSAVRMMLGVNIHYASGAPSLYGGLVIDTRILDNGDWATTVSIHT